MDIKCPHCGAEQPKKLVVKAHHRLMELPWVVPDSRFTLFCLECTKGMLIRPHTATTYALEGAIKQ